MPERLTSNRKVIGTKQLRKALKAGRVQTAYVAADADPILREPLVEQCRDAGVELVEIATMKELGKLCGIHVGAACAALLRLPSLSTFSPYFSRRVFASSVVSPHSALSTLFKASSPVLR